MSAFTDEVVPQGPARAKLTTRVHRNATEHDAFIAQLADIIVWMDTEGMPKQEREDAWKYHGITKREVEEAEEAVEARYQAAKHTVGPRRSRRSRL